MTRPGSKRECASIDVLDWPRAFLRQAVGTGKRRLGGTAAEFLIGAFLASDVDAMVSRGLFNSEGTVVITGGGVIAEAFSGALARLSARAVILDDNDVERALLAGCRSVFSVLGTVPRA